MVNGFVQSHSCSGGYAVSFTGLWDHWQRGRVGLGSRKERTRPSFLESPSNPKSQKPFSSGEVTTEMEKGVMEDAIGEGKGAGMDERRLVAKSDFHGAACRLQNVMHKGRIVAKSTVEIRR